MNKSRYDDDRLLDAFRSIQGWNTDIEIARFLNLTRATVSQIRRRIHRLTHEHRLIMLEQVGYVPKGFCDRISINALAFMLIRHCPALEYHLARFQREEAQPFTDPELLDMAKVALDIRFDRKLALTLHTPYQNIYVIRMGRNLMGVIPRLWLLEQFEPFGAESLIEVLTSTDQMLAALEKFKPASSDVPTPSPNDT